MSALVLLEALLGSLTLADFQDVEAHSLGQRTALTNGDNIAMLNISEHRGAVDAHVAVTLLETAVFAHKVQVVAPNDNGALHLGLADHAGQNATTDPHITGPGALLVDVGTIDGLTWGLETESHIAGATQQLLLGDAGLDLAV